MKFPVVLGAAFLFFSSACAMAIATWSWAYRPAKVQYEMYSGTLGEPDAPKSDDTKIAFEVSGVAAQHMFDAMGRDSTNICSVSEGARIRSKDSGRLVCIRSPQGQYSCNFGFELKTGKSIGGSIC